MRGQVRARTATAAVVLLALGVVATPWPAYAEPRVEVSADQVRPGQEIQVKASGLAPGELVDLKVCGVPDELGVLACAPALTGVEVDPVGVVDKKFVVPEPPGDCPCTVVVDVIGSAPILTRIELLGHPAATKAVAPDLVVDSAEITGGSTFGIGGSPELRLQVRNAGVSPAKATLELSWREGDGEAQPITDPELPEIPPGASRTVTVPLDLGGFKQGTYSVSGNAVVGDLYAPVEASASFVPWGLYGVVALVLVVGALYRTRAVIGVPKVTRNAPSGPPRPEAPPTATTAPPTAPVAPAAPTIPPPTPASVPEPVVEAAPTPVHAIPAEPLVGPPRLASTPIARPLGAPAPAAAGPAAPVTAAAAPAAGEPEVEQPAAAEADPSQRLSAYLEATTPRPAPRPTQPVQRPDPLSGSYAIPASIDDSGPIPAVAPAPLRLPEPAPEQAAPQQLAPSVLDGPSVLQRSLAPAEPARLVEPHAQDARNGQAPVLPDGNVPELVSVPAGAGPDAPLSGEQIVAQALASIKEHASGPVVHLPSQDDVPVPVQRDRRAPKGGKRAKR